MVRLEQVVLVALLLAVGVVVVVHQELQISHHITLALVVLMEAVLVDLVLVLVGHQILLLEQEQFALSGPVAPEHSHQLVQVTNNESIY
jgi:hypothetical protein